MVLVLTIPDLSAQACGKITYTTKDGISLPFYYTTLDSKGGIWVGSRGGGVNYFDGKTWKNFTIEDGLLSSWSWYFFEDNKGGIWINHKASEGVSRFINGKFQQYAALPSIQDTLLPDQQQFPNVNGEAANLFIDPYTKIVKAWSMDSTQNIITYDFDFNTSSFDLKGNSFLEEKVLKKQSSLIKAARNKGFFHINNKEYLWFLSQDNKETNFIAKNGKIKKLPISLLDRNTTLLNSPSGENYSFLLEKENKCMLFKDNIWREVAQPKLFRYGTRADSISMRFHSYHHGQNAFLSKGLFCTVWQVEAPDLPNTFVLAEHDLDSHSIVQTTLFNEIPDQLDIRMRIVKDKAGTYWYSNGQEVVRLFPDQMILKVDQQDLPSDTWGVTGGHDNRLWFSSYSNNPGHIALRSFDGIKLHLPKDDLRPFYRFNDSGTRDQQGNNYFPSASNRKTQIPDLGILKMDSVGRYEVLCPGIQGFYIDWDHENNLLFGTHNKGLWKLPKEKKGIDHSDWIKIDASKGLKLKNVVTALEDHKGRYWMGRGGQGLAVYLPAQDTIYNWVKQDDPNHLGIQSMAEDHHGNLWLGSEKGLYFYKNKNIITSDFDIQDRKMELVATDYLGESLIQVCKIYDEHTLIVGNKKGFFLIDLDAWYGNAQQLLIYEYNPKNGNTAGEINQNGVHIDHNKHIWLTGNKGVMRFDPDLLPRDSFPPEVSLDSMVVGENSYTTFNKNIRLRATERTVKISFSHLPNLLFYDNIKFRYRLTGDEKWSTLTDQAAIEYQNLSAGSYTFEVLAEKNGLQSSPKKLTFRISKVLWQNPLFWLAILGFFLAAGLYYRKKEKESYKQELLIERKNLQMANLNKDKERLQVQTIVNQLNPHFINNALQWLQIRLDENNDQEAVSVVGKLSENISTVFKNSRDNKAFHSLYTEMTLVQNYLFIQKRRFKEDLEYDLPDFKYLAAYEAINIPLLMIQIHVENAVEHGIRNRKGTGTVKISIETEPKMIVIKIEDDGVGRKAAQKIGSKGTQNGIKMLKELETIFNKQNELPISQIFEDGIFTDENGMQYGTRMVIRLPRKYNYNL